MRFLKVSAGLLMVYVYLSMVSTAHCQTVGNGTIIAPATGAQDGNAVPQIGGSESAFATRHYNRGNNSGIGSSFLGTDSPTSESSPAIVVPQTVPTTAMQFRLPKLDSAINDNGASPALQSLTPALPAMPQSSALHSFMSSPSFASDYSHNSVENLPSFSRKPSLLNKLQFDDFGK